MDDNESMPSSVKVEGRIRDMHIKIGLSSREAPGRLRAGEVKEKEERNSPRPTRTKSSTQSPIKSEKPSLSPDNMKEDNEEIVGGEVVVKLVPGHAPKLARTPTQKIVARPAPLFHSYEDKTEESKTSFQVITGCIYSSKYIGSTEHAMECDCTEEWGKTIRTFFLRITTESLIQIARPGSMGRAGMIRTASIVQLRWSASATVGVEQIARTNAFNARNMQT